LKRAVREAGFPEIRLPDYSFVVRPSVGAVLATLADLTACCDAEPFLLSVDIETRSQQIACIGLAWSSLDALCIPLLCVESPEGYWSPEDELAITVALRRLLTHPNCSVIGQNFLYDAQYFAKQYGYVPNVLADTMLMQHVAFPGTPKSLDYLSSMYCRFHQYWKGEGKLWNPKTTPEEQLWTYNCKDAVITFEVYNTLVGVLHKCGLWEIFQRQMRLFTPVLRMMLRGVRIDAGYRKELATTLLGEIAERETSINNIAGFTLNPRSPKQMKAFFYDDLRLPIQFNRKTRKPSLDDEALDKLAKKEVLVRPLIKLIREIRSLGVFNSTFVGAALDTDGRIRCSFNISGTETFRFSSSENAFGSGTNLQNIPKGKEDDASLSADDLRLPNVRKLFIPDSGFTIADCDQSGADAQVVAWEANDDILKQLFRSGVKIHAHNAKDLYGADAGPDGKREPYYSRTKQGVHLSNYGGTARTLATTIGITIHEAEKFQRRWFDIHPGIKDWHRRIESDLQTRRFVANRFGYRRFYFGRVEELLPEALAWIPQSTVAIVTNTALERIDREFPAAELLLQVHDSLVFQYATAAEEQTLSRIRPLLAVVVPYDDPLVIPWGLKTSTKSWGACEDRKWPRV
jgi:DNA polymerase-1